MCYYFTQLVPCQLNLKPERNMEEQKIRVEEKCVPMRACYVG